MVWRDDAYICGRRQCKLDIGQQKQIEVYTSKMYMADGDRERAVKEVAQVYERIKAHHPLLHLHYCSSPTPSTTTTHQLQLLAQSLLGDALRALNIALSVMKQQQQPRSVVKAEPPQLSPPSPASADSQAAVAIITARRPNKKRRSSSSVMMEEAAKTCSSWVDFTTVPYEDGYVWRKYGEKKINGTTYTRSYFRCSYKDDTGCLATKHVQQKQDSTDNSSDPPMFQVTYNNHHTCKGAAAAAAAMNNIKQEPPAVRVLPPPPAVEAYCSALAPFHQTPPPPCQQEPSPFPIGMHQQQQPAPWCAGTASTSSATTSSSCISGESCSDQYSDMVQMAAAELASAGDYCFLYDDLERYFLLGDHSFNIQEY